MCIRDRDETQKLYNPDMIFRFASDLTKITINSSIQFNGIWFMYGLANLIEVTGPDNHPGCSFLDGCVYNKDFTELLYCPSGKKCELEDLPDSVVAIGKYAFVQNRHLSKFIVPDKIVSLGTWCCYRTPITEVFVPENCSITGDNNFGRCNNLTKATLNTTNITATSLFESCENLETVTLANGLPSIPNSMFANCSSLDNVTIPDSVTSIGTFAFYNCGTLTEITIPKNVISIGSQAFSYDALLGTIISLPLTAPSLGNNVFDGSKGTPPVTYYVGCDVSGNKILRVVKGSVNYDKGDWQNVLQDLAGFLIDSNLT